MLELRIKKLLLIHSSYERNCEARDRLREATEDRYADRHLLIEDQHSADPNQRREVNSQVRLST
jgi:hypothetical protein